MKIKSLVIVLISLFICVGISFIFAWNKLQNDIKPRPNVDNEPNANLSQDTLVKNLIVLTNLSDLDKYSFDTIDFKSAYLENGLLYITLGYSGGCKDHTINLISYKTSLYTSYLTLAHESNDDMCEAYITSTMSFNISNLADSIDSNIVKSIIITKTPDISANVLFEISTSSLVKLVTPKMEIADANNLVINNYKELANYDFGNKGYSIEAIKTLDGIYLAYLTKESEFQITNARCFKVDSNENITKTGEYNYQMISSFMATSINPANCFVGDPSQKLTNFDKIYLGTNPYDLDTEDGILFTKRDALNKLKTTNPQFEKEEMGLPPIMYYYFKNKENTGWVIVRTLEGSGVKAIFSATCYEVTPDAIATLGTYDGNPSSSVILEDIYGLDPFACKLR